MGFLAAWLSFILRNPAEVQLLLAALESLPGVSAEVKADVAVIADLGSVWAAKKSGQLIFRPDDGSGDISIHAIKF